MNTTDALTAAVTAALTTTPKSDVEIARETGIELGQTVVELGSLMLDGRAAQTETGWIAL